MKFKAGDAIIRYKNGIRAVCEYGFIIDDGILPSQWNFDTIAGAHIEAEKFLEKTKGNLHEFTI